MLAWLDGGGWNKREQWSREMSMLSKRQAWRRLTHAFMRRRKRGV